MPEASLLTAEVRALIGRATDPVTVTVSRKAVERAVELFGASREGVPGAGERAPGYVLSALEPEPASLDLPNLMPDQLLIGNEWEFERPLVVGEELVLRTRIADISERLGGRFGYSLYIRSEVEVCDPAGELVARSFRTMMQYDPRNAREGDET